MQYSISYLRDDSIAVAFNSFYAPSGNGVSVSVNDGFCKNGGRIQQVGKPIISSTNRGLSREVFPVRYAIVSLSC